MSRYKKQRGTEPVRCRSVRLGSRWSCSLGGPGVDSDQSHEFVAHSGLATGRATAVRFGHNLRRRHVVTSLRIVTWTQAPQLDAVVTWNPATLVFLHT